uniref:Uncharacterized protein n=1 Tax=Chromera velia CCMP2878 TaxID=1169474 RepID=A0A0G4GGN5_9ALVE|mmetsp:Transcript_24683/g.48407  ORF Transcript_24683/g.48407 Transcript_24683/m.48407 type:complete len:253 (+) Transcript_24683:202-960(+)|eukprot:Cvel_21760.t1-p1 / transcript=Cvel_21760.t1 / gene=Cvel_21760 / organism=Chromera_velia_CCMP2878 / gene_product=26S proteasome non-ATPase regulatory subunit 10, putative / transcript_product=26S proteasome non-ATPase regulatory subunit 10, putative / location=Cvel_scaffold2069:5973-10890(-) / protein_length=252 / sequence_SO=supercontig / SO=protein_coding / is_pseudo=false
MDLLPQTTPQTIFCQAAAEGNVDKMKEMASKDAKLVTGVDPDDRTAFHWAAGKNQVGAMEFLVQSGFKKVGRVDEEGWSALHSAASGGHLQSVAFILHHSKERQQKGEKGGVVDLDAQTSSGQTALHMAAGKGHMEVAKSLLEAGAEVDVKDRQQNTALARACAASRQDIAALLIKQGATTRTQERLTGDTPLHMAVNAQHNGICEMLCKRDPHLLNVKNAEGKTPINEAPEELKVLLREYEEKNEKGENIN